MIRLKNPIAMAFCAGLSILGVDPAVAEPRTYKGSEAQALKCAAYFAYTSQVLESQGKLSTQRAIVANKAALDILEQHVSGTFKQKMGAYRVVVDGLPKSEAALVSEASQNVDSCKKRFLK